MLIKKMSFILLHPVLVTRTSYDRVSLTWWPANQNMQLFSLLNLLCIADRRNQVGVSMFSKLSFDNSGIDQVRDFAEFASDVFAANFAAKVAPIPTAPSEIRQLVKHDPRAQSFTGAAILLKIRCDPIPSSGEALADTAAPCKEINCHRCE
ncbi:MAG: hypothetical protein ABSH14_16990 [Verrucomicrobiia bacterium]